MLYDSLKENRIISKFILYEDEKYELYTNDFGIITFYNIKDYIPFIPLLPSVRTSSAP